MNGTHALGQIRALGVTVEVAGEGLRLHPPRREAIEIAKANKPAIIGELRAEAFDDISYESSGCYHWIERTYDAAKALERSGIDVTPILKRLRDLDDAMTTKFDRERFDKEVVMIREMCGPAIDATGYLGGQALHDMVKREVGALGRNLEAFAA